MERSPTKPLPTRGTPAWWRDRGLLRVLLLGLALRAVILLALWHQDPTVRALYSDPELYFRWANAWACGQDFEPGRPFWLPPGYPALLALLFRIGGPSIAWVLFVQALGGLLDTLLLWRLAERTAGRRAATAAAIAWTLYLPVLFFETRLLAVNLALPLALLSLLAWVELEERLQSGRPLARTALLAGLWCGLAALCRPNLALLGPAAGVGLACTVVRRSGWPALLRAGVLSALGLALGLAPGWTLNQWRSGQGFAVSANGGANFWFANQAGSRGTFVAPSPEWGSIATQRETASKIAGAALGREAVDESTASRYFFEQGWRFLKADPARWAGLWGKKLAAQLSSTEWGIQYSPTTTRRFVPWLWLLPLPFGLLLFLAAMGRIERGRGALTGWLVGGLVATLLYFTYSRFRLPWLPALMPWVGAGWLCVWDGAWKRRENLWRLIPAGALLAQSFVAFEGPYARQMEAHLLVDAARSSRRLEEPPERARQLLELALKWVPGEAAALTELGNLELSLGNLSAARERFESAVALGLDHWPADLGLCSSLVASAFSTQREPDEALTRIDTWLLGHPADAPGRAQFLALGVSIAALALDPPDPTRARTYLENLRSLEPDFPALPALEAALRR